MSYGKPYTLAHALAAVEKQSTAIRKVEKEMAPKPKAEQEKKPMKTFKEHVAK